MRGRIVTIAAWLVIAACAVIVAARVHSHYSHAGRPGPAVYTPAPLVPNVSPTASATTPASSVSTTARARPRRTHHDVGHGDGDGRVRTPHSLLSMSDVPWRIGPPANDEDMPEVGKKVQAGDSVAVCSKVEWRYVPPTTEGEPVECHSQEVAEACVRGHGRPHRAPACLQRHLVSSGGEDG